MQNTRDQIRALDDLQRAGSAPRAARTSRRSSNPPWRKWGQLEDSAVFYFYVVFSCVAGLCVCKLPIGCTPM